MRIIGWRTGRCGLLGGGPGEKCFAPTVSDDAMVPKFHTVVILRVVAEPTSAVLRVLDPATAQSLAQDDVFLGEEEELGHADHRVENRTMRVVGWRTGRPRGDRPYGVGPCDVFSDPISCLNPD